MSERVPFLATRNAERYDGLKQIPVSLLLDDIRSMYNVGAFFRTADAAGVARIYVCGITPLPTQPGVAKTALGSEAMVPWSYATSAVEQMESLREAGFQLAAVETQPHAVDLFDWEPDFPICMLFGNEVEGLKPELLAACDLSVQIPMLGVKHSLNVATAGGVVMYELLRKYRSMMEAVHQRR